MCDAIRVLRLDYVCDTLMWLRGAIYLRLRSSFFKMKYTNLGVNLPPESFSEMAPWLRNFSCVPYCIGSFVEYQYDFEVCHL